MNITFRLSRSAGLLALAWVTSISPVWAQANKELTEAELIEYRPGDSNLFKPVWDEFYAGDFEGDLPKPLIAAGKPMVADICNAIAHPDMRFRRYAMTALGEIGDRAALPALAAILKDRNELDYMRGDALEAIHRIDKTLGLKYGKEFGGENDYLKMIASEISH